MRTNMLNGWGLAAMSGCLALVLAAGGCEKKQAAEVSGPAEAAPSGAGSVAAARPAAPATEAPDLEELIEKFPSLQRVEQALAGAPINAGLTRTDLLEKARAWMTENAGDLTPREQELQAQILAILEELMDAEELSLSKAVALSESQLLGLWGMDADGDGRLSEEEALAGMGKMMALDGVMRDYFSDRLDTDGDGVVSDAEAQKGQELMLENQMPMIDTMIERAGLVSWDINADGVLSEDEIAEGEAGLTFQDFNGDGEIKDMERLAGYQPMLLQMGQAMTLLEQPDQMALQAEIRGEIEGLTADLMPTETDFDLDGDGDLGEIERQAFTEATAAAQQEIQTRSMEVVQQSAARYVMAQYDIAINRMDTDDNGALMDEEWEAGYRDLRVERDQKMFEYLYDADRDGSVTDPEVARFMDSYEQESPYADANLDGRVDTDDLRHFLGQVSGQ